MLSRLVLLANGANQLSFERELWEQYLLRCYGVGDYFDLRHVWRGLTSGQYLHKCTFPTMWRLSTVSDVSQISQAWEHSCSEYYIPVIDSWIHFPLLSRACRRCCYTTASHWFLIYLAVLWPGKLLAYIRSTTTWLESLIGWQISLAWIVQIASSSNGNFSLRTP